MSFTPATVSDPFDLGRLQIDLAACEALVDNTPVHLKPREFRLLLYFARNPRLVLSREQIMCAVWRDCSYDVDKRTVDHHVRRLREKIAEPFGLHPFIATRPKFGYMFEMAKPTRADDAWRVIHDNYRYLDSRDEAERKTAITNIVQYARARQGYDENGEVHD